MERKLLAKIKMKINLAQMFTVVWSFFLFLFGAAPYTT